MAGVVQAVLDVASDSLTQVQGAGRLWWWSVVVLVQGICAREAAAGCGCLHAVQQGWRQPVHQDALPPPTCALHALPGLQGHGEDDGQGCGGAGGAVPFSEWRHALRLVPRLLRAAAGKPGSTMRGFAISPAHTSQWPSAGIWYVTGCAELLRNLQSSLCMEARRAACLPIRAPFAPDTPATICIGGF